MKKILPININPYIRSYTHHGYHHSVISTHDKIYNNKIGEAACVKIKKFSEYNWSHQLDELNFVTCKDDTLKFYGNKWNIDMNAAFWRKCNSCDEIELCINNQFYTNVWASIYLFLSDNTELPMTDYDNAYNLVFGNFSKDGIYYKNNKSVHIIVFPSPTFPLTIRLVKTETNFILIYRDAAQNENELILNIDEYDGPNERIGFGVNYRCNSYYEWLFSNYINIYVNLNSPIPIDFLCDKHKNWNRHTYNPFLDFNAETENDLHIMGYTLIDYIKKNIDLNRYVETLINDNIHLNNTANSYFHQDLIYGYDDDAGCFYLLYYKSGKVCPITMTYSDFLSTDNLLQHRTIYIYKYNPAYEGYKISPPHILQVLKEYRHSQNITYYEPYFDSDYHYGINGMKSFLSNRGQEIFLSDIRVSHLLYEHSKCNNDRIEYLHCRKFLSTTEYKKINDLAQKSCNRALIIRNLILKKKYGGKTNSDTIMDYFKDYITLEIELADETIQAIEKYIQNNTPMNE